MDIQYYNAIIEYRSWEKVIVYIQGPFTQDIVAGMVVGIDLNQQQLYRTDIEVEIDIETNKEPYIFHNLYSHAEFIDYIMMTSYTPIKITPPPGKYGVWVSPYARVTGLYKFIVCDRMDEFMQGFITVCNKANLQYQSYISNIIDSNGNEYTIKE